MTDDRLPLAELMQVAGGDDFLRSVAEAVVQLLIGTDMPCWMPSVDTSRSR